MTEALTPEPKSGTRAPGLCLQLVDGARTISTCIGVASLEFDVAITPNTRANFGSVAKQITAHLVVLSARAGRLRLDDSVRRYLPRFGLADATVLDLLQHRGGVRDAESLLSLVGFRDLDHYTAADLLELAYRQRAYAGLPGRFLYSNTGYLLLAAILESVYSCSFDTIARELVFSPASMSRTAFRGHPNQVISESAAAYGKGIDGHWRHEGRPVALAGPGSMWSTIVDVDRWLAFVWEEWLDQPAGRLPFAAEVPYLDASPAPFFYGPGICASTSDSRGAIQLFHAGHEHGFSAYAHLDRQGRRISCWSNRADLRADVVGSRIADLSEETQPASEAVLLQFLQAAIDELDNTRPDTIRSIDSENQVEIGIFRCEDIPGVVRLARSATTADLFLWRRGAVDRLTAVGAGGRLFRGGGITIEMVNKNSRDLTSFTLHLERAPDLHYSRSQS